MTQKLLLAEGLDLLRQCEQREYDVDRTKLRISSSSRYRSELGRLLQSYDTVYHQYVRGIQILNYVRHTALADKNPQNAQYSKNLSEFCAAKITAYMTRCSNIIRKTDSILVPIEQIDLITKEGYTPEDTVYLQDGITYPLSRKEKIIAKEFTLTAGTYVLTLKNRDDYTLAAPEVDVTLVVLPQRGSGLEPSRVEMKLPCQCGWRKVVGVVDVATVQLEIRYSGIRDAHIDVLFQKWCAIEDIGRSGGAASGPGPALSPSTFDSGDCNSVCKPPPNRGGNGGAAGGVSHHSCTPTNVSASDAGAPAHQQPQQWVNSLPQLPDDELATLANYNVPSASLPRVSDRPANDSEAASSAAPSSAEDPWTTLANLNVPYAPTTRNAPSAASVMRVPEPVEVNPAGMTCRQRLDKIHQLMDAWPSIGVVACALPAEPQSFMQGVHALPFPRELSA
ncbi:protein of unknown function - conserved [Leishmania donovani]|uniref:Uncharacterized protein n=3 Tax=Leishmania donovani species complex TaxID=38574 RepID=A4HSY4_LEIIN|nr:conserved hypothetical protein [Leishmania infantum JPCM5]XP_003858401.1 hypothetical protein, conserved [Leishmania donovani]CAC9446592.1 hypothetical_protein_-_conserved [Leishmania infantum]AYU76125.1 hypothetical protein LdCL_060014600 [Leishmania donovani]CAJ1986192.1 protein of unknown function - conserved [Leishmania donovani]CAM65526.1 conserved hypothetical protein [Leishmania infantum JPCM5]CBZ31678.1 hypothetical protein, conserved [Leishmania donovani]|eukprot:XP_001463175.1 conserved hypothetical protein [Leishmania infantum JPCM5]